MYQLFKRMIDVQQFKYHLIKGKKNFSGQILMLSNLSNNNKIIIFWKTVTIINRQISKLMTENLYKMLHFRRFKLKIWITFKINCIEATYYALKPQLLRF